MARVRAKRTEWRMRGTEPNKNVTSFSPHPSCLRDASAIHLPARSIATSPLWLKTVTCGLFLRCFTPPRRAPSGEGLTGCVHSCYLGALVEKDHTAENENNRIRYAAGRGRPALPTASSALKPNVRIVISSVSREIPYNRNGTLHIRASLPARGGSPPRNPLR